MSLRRLNARYVATRTPAGQKTPNVALGLAFPFGDFGKRGRTPMHKLLYPSAGFGIADSSPSRFSGTRVSLSAEGEWTMPLTIVPLALVQGTLNTGSGPASVTGNFPRNAGGTPRRDAPAIARAKLSAPALRAGPMAGNCLRREPARILSRKGRCGADCGQAGFLSRIRRPLPKGFCFRRLRLRAGEKLAQLSVITVFPRRAAGASVEVSCCGPPDRPAPPR